MNQDDDKQLPDPIAAAVPSDSSDHDERDEDLATEKDWDLRSDDPMAVASGRLEELKRDGVPLSEEDWEDEEETDDELPDHVSEAVDQAEDSSHEV